MRGAPIGIGKRGKMTGVKWSYRGEATRGRLILAKSKGVSERAVRNSLERQLTRMGVTRKGIAISLTRSRQTRNGTLIEFIGGLR